MPKAASELGSDPFFHALVLGAAKSGKSTSIITSLANAYGEGYVICCGDKSGMAPAKRRTSKFRWDLVRDEHDMEACIKEARAGQKEGWCKWVFVDDFSLYATWLEGSLRDASAAQSKKNEADGRRYWPEFKSRLLNIPRRLFDIKCHIIFASHFIESTGGEIEDKDSGARQRAKSGPGIMPMIGGSAREELPALFQDVLFLENIDGRRVFQVNPQGVWGPGARSADGTHTIDADFAALAKLAKEQSKGR